MASSLDARSAGICLLRIDDLDVGRCRPDHENAILRALAACALKYPDPVLRQSTRSAIYAAAVHRLATRLELFFCDCTRRDLAGDGEPCCVRDCRRAKRDPTHSALRADLSSLVPITVVDRSLGEIRFDPTQQRDVVVRRRDGIHAYQLATVIDDAEQGVTDVVRGADLLPSTGWQLALQQALGLTHPRYLHLPLVVEADGQKLAKSRHSAALDPTDAPAQLRRVLAWLKQETPPADKGTAAEILAWAAERWNPTRFLGLREVRL